MKTVFLRVTGADDKASAMMDALHKPGSSDDGFQRHEVDAGSFASVPGSPFCYWVSEEYRQLYVDLPPFEGSGRSAKVGVQTSDDFRFVRAWWEVPTVERTKQWVTFLKGGSASSFYSDIHLCLSWSQEGREVKAFAESTPGTSHWSRMIRSPEWYFRPGISWAVRTSRFSPSVVPEGCIFSVSRYQAFTERDNLLPILGFLNGASCTELLKMCSERFEHPKYIIGIVQSLPFPSIAEADRVAFGEDALRAWSLKYRLDTRSEISHAFNVPAILQVAGSSLEERVVAWKDLVAATDAELAQIQTNIDLRCAAVYGISGSARPDINTLEHRLHELDKSAPDQDDGGDETDTTMRNDTTEMLASELVSWAIGVAFARFDLRSATSATATSPIMPDAFAKLPSRSVGMLNSNNSHLPDQYPLELGSIVALVNDRGHSDDVEGVVRQVFAQIFTEPDRWTREIGNAIEPKTGNIGTWISQNYFEHHVRQYTKSKRKAPIYWQISVPSGRYSIWLYSQAVNKDTLFRLYQEVIAPKLLHEERALGTLIQEMGGLTTAEQARVEAQQEFVTELRQFAEEVNRVAPIWNPDLDDSVVLTMAPLWRLVPQHNAWQKELISKWQELQEGKYDWSHLAMHLWPERVVPKCASNRSLAIAHDLLENFWFEAAGDKWEQRLDPDRSITELIEERSSLAITQALANFLEAPGPTTKRGRKGKRG
ncbi:hypothetical protein GR223_33950 [Rhizobium leguminosarum]|uniref:hypothetical protein n=1 Tax=Rhizobium ruizarguesonis TaxID=2081791 RepID=UPI0013DEFFEF|nr:hypothetical protein [Rhizobium ruizarguesonis]NEJ90894.1 hypothetical protein [Rhizobium ruizarguesonis]